MKTIFLVWRGDRRSGREVLVSFSTHEQAEAWCVGAGDEYSVEPCVLDPDPDESIPGIDPSWVVTIDVDNGLVRDAVCSGGTEREHESWPCDPCIRVQRRVGYVHCRATSPARAAQIAGERRDAHKATCPKCCAR